MIFLVSASLGAWKKQANDLARAPAEQKLWLVQFPGRRDERKFYWLVLCHHMLPIGQISSCRQITTQPSTWDFQVLLFQFPCLQCDNSVKFRCRKRQETRPALGKPGCTAAAKGEGPASPGKLVGSTHWEMWVLGGVGRQDAEQ